VKGQGAFTNAGWNAFATFTGIAINLLLAPVLIRNLGTGAYGLLLLVWSSAGLLSVTNLGVGEATLRFVSHYIADGDAGAVNRVFRSTLAFYAIVCGGVVLFMFAAAPAVVGLLKVEPDEREIAGWLLRLAGLLFALEMVSNAFRSIPMALHRYDVSSKLSVAQGFVRGAGFSLLAFSGFGVLYVVLWDLLVSSVVLIGLVRISRRLMPALQVAPKVSRAGMREIFGYGVYSFLTHLFLSLYRESGKFILGNRIGTTAVAYLGTPDAIAYRIYMIVVSGIETLMPRFSASRDGAAAQRLVVRSTGAALSASVVLLTPLASLMPDFLRLWIDPEFARESARVGQVLAISFFGPAAYAPIATYFRGVGRPGVVTLVMALVGVLVIGASLGLVPSYGALGVAYGYGIGAIGWLSGLVVGWFYLLKRGGLRPLARCVLLPLLEAALLVWAQPIIRGWFGEVGWSGLVLLGAAFAGLSAGLVLGVDWLLGGDAVSIELARRVLSSARMETLRRRIPLWRSS
jgi:O-antigen/teichoic acid export membrane protein